MVALSVSANTAGLAPRPGTIVAVWISCGHHHTGDGRSSGPRATQIPRNSAIRDRPRRCVTSSAAGQAHDPADRQHDHAGADATTDSYAAIVARRTSAPGRAHNAASNTSTSIGPV